MFAFLLNLPVPMLFGGGISQGPGLTGVAIGLLLLIGIGWRICLAYPKFINCFCLGTLIVAAGQFFPVLHALAGIVAVVTVGTLSATMRPEMVEQGLPLLGTFHDGLFVTLLAGGLMAVIAIALGLFMRFIWPGYAKRERQPRRL